MRVLITDFLTESDFEREVLPGVEVDALLALLGHPPTPADLVRFIAERPAAVLISWYEMFFDSTTLAALSRAGVVGIVRAGVGFDNIDLVGARAAGITVCNVPDYGTDEVADHAMALLLWCLRCLRAAPPTAAPPTAWWDAARFASVLRLRECTLGLLGFSCIGQATARRAQSFGLNVRWYDPYVPRGQDKVTRTTRDAEAAKRFFVKALGSSAWVASHGGLTEEKGDRTPVPADRNPSRRNLRVITVDKNAAYPKAIAELKTSGILPASVELRQVNYLNNLMEQDHRFMKRRVKPGRGFFSFETAWRTLQGYEVLHMMRKGHMRGVEKGNIMGQMEFIAHLFGVAAEAEQERELHAHWCPPCVFATQPARSTSSFSERMAVFLFCLQISRERRAKFASLTAIYLWPVEWSGVSPPDERGHEHTGNQSVCQGIVSKV